MGSSNKKKSNNNNMKQTETNNIKTIDKLKENKIIRNVFGLDTNARSAPLHFFSSRPLGFNSSTVRHVATVTSQDHHGNAVAVS